MCAESAKYCPLHIVPVTDLTLRAALDLSMDQICLTVSWLAIIIALLLTTFTLRA